MRYARSRPGGGAGRSSRHTGRPPRAAPAKSLTIATGLLGTLILMWQACRPAAPDNGDGALLGPDPVSTVSITLAWDPPETDAVGRPLQDLASYRIYFGHESPLDTARDTFVDVGLVTTYTLQDLPPGTYFFATTAIDESGNESALSGEVGAELSLP